MSIKRLLRRMTAKISGLRRIPPPAFYANLANFQKASFTFAILIQNNPRNVRHPPRLNLCTAKMRLCPRRFFATVAIRTSTQGVLRYGISLQRSIQALAPNIRMGRHPPRKLTNWAIRWGPPRRIRSPHTRFGISSPPSTTFISCRR